MYLSYEFLAFFEIIKNMIINIASITIAILSLLLSIYVISRDRRSKKFDNLLTCRQKILSAFDDQEILSVDEMVEFFEEMPESEEAQKHKAKSQSIMFRVDREFEFTCFLVIKKEIELLAFFDIFKVWLTMRKDTFNLYEYKKINLPYTWEIIQLCTKSKLLPLSKTFTR